PGPGRQGAPNHRPAARTRHPSADAAPATDHRCRPRVPGCCESSIATRAVAILHRHAGDAAALAATPCQPVNVRASRRPAADSGGDARAGGAVRARETAWGYDRIVA